MREATWETPPALPARIAEGRLRIEMAAPGPLAWVTGDLSAALSRIAPGKALTGYTAEEAGDPAGYRIALDRALLLGAAAEALPDGWHGAFAISRCDGAWTEARIEGEGARAVMSMTVAHPLDAPSPSAAMLVAGRMGLVARHATGWRLLVEAPHTAFHAARLAALASEIAR